MSIVIQYIVTFVPILIAMLMECGILKWACGAINKIKETNEYKKLIEQNKQLMTELQEAKKLNKELLTKIDRIARGE